MKLFSIYAPYEKKSNSAASLGQVHIAISKKGEKLACKLQYPDMQSTIQADLNQLKMVFSVYEKTSKAISTSSIHSELSARLYEELNYKREAANIKLFSEMLKNEKQIHVPKVFKDLSSDRLLTMSWLEGKKLTDWLENKPSLEERNNLALNMFKAWYVPFYFYGVIHGDPHLGNYSITQKNEINLLEGKESKQLSAIVMKLMA